MSGGFSANSGNSLYGKRKILSLKSYLSNIRTWIAQRKIEFVISIPNPEKRVEFDSDYCLRRMAVDFSIPILTNFQVADLFVQAISDYPLESLAAKHWTEYE